MLVPLQVFIALKNRLHPPRLVVAIMRTDPSAKGASRHRYPELLRMPFREERKSLHPLLPISGAISPMHLRSRNVMRESNHQSKNRPQDNKLPYDLVVRGVAANNEQQT